MISFDAMQTELKSRLGNRTDLDSRMVRWINYAFFELLMNPRFSFFELDAQVPFQTVAGANDYTLLFYEGFWFILDLRDTTNERKIKRSHYNQIDRIVQSRGQPTRYYRFGNSLFFDPIPDGTYTMVMRYRRRPNDLSTGSTFEGLGTEWEELIVTLAAVKAFTGLKQPEESMKQKQLMELLISSMLDVPELEDGDSENTLEVALTPRY